MTKTTNGNPATGRPCLRALLPDELSAMLAGAGFDAYRGRQLFHWLHARVARSLDEMTNLPRAMRDWLGGNTDLGGVASAVAERSSADGSTKFLFSLRDGRKIESVLMPDPKRGYFTMCISSQVGCAVDCKFCLTGKGGFFRNMTADEIADQVLFARRTLRERDPNAVFRNLVYMGMGEPLLNTENVIRSIRLLTNSNGADFSPRRITVSTSGIIPGLRELGAADTGVNLAVSLNATTQAEREVVMPITRKYPLDELLAALREYPLRNNRRITFEYVLLKGVNDTPAHARRILAAIRGIPSKVNVIPFNPHPMLDYERPDREVVDRFVAVLLEGNVTVSVRWSKALDVSGACGNLATEFRQRGGARIPAEATPAAPMPDDLEFFALAAPAAGDDEGDDDE